MRCSKRSAMHLRPLLLRVVHWLLISFKGINATQRDAYQAYLLSSFDSEREHLTLIVLRRERRPVSWFDSDGRAQYRQTSVAVKFAVRFWCFLLCFTDLFTSVTKTGNNNLFRQPTRDGRNLWSKKTARTQEACCKGSQQGRQHVPPDKKCRYRPLILSRSLSPHRRFLLNVVWMTAFPDLPESNTSSCPLLPLLFSLRVLNASAGDDARKSCRCCTLEFKLTSLVIVN